jgi:hypothetical protein
MSERRGIVPVSEQARGHPQNMPLATYSVPVCTVHETWAWEGGGSPRQQPAASSQQTAAPVRGAACGRLAGAGCLANHPHVGAAGPICGIGVEVLGLGLRLARFGYIRECEEAFLAEPGSISSA